MTTEEGADVTDDEAADWLIRSALPPFLDLTTLARDADYLWRLPPF